MNSKLVLFFSAVGTADAAWGIGWCKNRAPPEMPDLNKKEFSGHWYEIYRDTNHDWWSNQACTESYYSTGIFGNDFTLER